MGMFDTIHCKYPLSVEGANDYEYQTKDLHRALDLFKIELDGTLWVIEFDIEDQSKATKWKKENPGKELPPELKGLAGIAGRATRVNKRWIRVHYNRTINFYTSLSPAHSGWIEWRAKFVDGKTDAITLIEHTHTDADRQSTGSTT